MSSYKLQLTSAIIMALTLSACGGGGSSSTQTDTTSQTNSNTISDDSVGNNSDSGDNDTGDDIDNSDDDTNPAALSIVSQPSSQTLASSSSITLSLGVDSTNNYSVTWFKNGSEISQSNSYQLSNLTVSDSGTYSCTVTSGDLSDQCSDFTLTVLDAPSINEAPGNQVVTEGDSVVLEVDASGSDLTYQWYFNNQPLFGEVSSQLELSDISVDQEGTYYCVVSNAVGSDTSSSATVSVFEATVYGQVEVTWTPPTTRADGSVLNEDEIQGYKVYYGLTSANDYTDYIEVSGTEATLTELELGDYKLAVSTVDVNGYESELTEEFLVAVQ